VSDEAPREPGEHPKSDAPPSRFVLDPRRATGRLFAAAALGVIATMVSPAGAPLHVRAVAGWDAAALTLLALAWHLIGRASPTETARRAASEDPGRSLVFVIAIGSSFFSLFAGAVVLRSAKTLPDATLWTWLALAAVALSWTVTHTAFTLRYAHLFYRKRGSGGLSFPGTDRPCELDFAYFSFTIGMCFQASDVVVTSGRIRRVVLLHSLISFVYNTAIIALSLNLAMGLLS